MRRLYYVILIGALMVVGVAAKAQAAPITISAGETVIFNFDLVAAGVTPSPPYDAVRVDMNASGCCTGDLATLTFWSDLNASRYAF